MASNKAGLEDQEIADAVLEAILDHRLKAGAKLGEQALCDVFSTSRSQVRRVLLILANRSIVDQIPNRGTFVATPSLREAHNIFQARRAVEAAVVRNAAESASAESIAELEQMMKDEHAAAQAGARREMIRLSGAFHLKLAAVSGNGVLERFVEELVMRSSLIIGLYWQGGDDACSDGAHAELIKALRAKNKRAAAELMENHLNGIEQGLSFSGQREPANLADVLSGPQIIAAPA